jgi:tRNA threonylcarbamoyladenosine biosynthesis protein TsaB
VSRLVLAIDTTLEIGSLALARGDEILEEVEVRAPAGFAQILYRELEELLARNRVSLRDIDCFAAASGPGSFTGVRVGLACVKGLAEALGKPAAGVSNLKALASLGTAPLRAAIIDARRGEVYAAIYDDAGRVVSPEVVTRREQWTLALPARDPAGDIEWIEQDLAAPRKLAGAIARIAPPEMQDPAGLDANYVRRSDAELSWKE